MRIAIVGRWISLTILVLGFFLSCSEDEDNPVGGGPEPLPVPVYFDHPAWHPEGKWIAVEHSDSIDADGDGRLEQGFSGIWLINSNTGEKQPLISGYALPAWSPDGKFLALVQASQIFTVRVMSLEPAQIDSNSLTQLTLEGRNFYPAWSPDGKWIAYDRTIPVDSNGIWIIRPKGGSKIKVADGRFPDWHPDGSQIIFIGFHREVYRVNLNDSSIVRLTSLNQRDIYATSNYHPKYSHDGAEIAFYSKPSIAPPCSLEDEI